VSREAGLDAENERIRYQEILTRSLIYFEELGVSSHESLRKSERQQKPASSPLRTREGE
jgi:hypothetical protein